jgi:hypothetical protein
MSSGSLSSKLPASSVEHAISMNHSSVETGSALGSIGETIIKKGEADTIELG